jgi:hypothetical protein
VKEGERGWIVGGPGREASPEENLLQILTQPRRGHRSLTQERVHVCVDYRIDQVAIMAIEPAKKPRPDPARAVSILQDGLDDDPVVWPRWQDE